jgi:hypothetical protein
MAKKKPYWVRTLFKLKHRVRAMEEELKPQKQTSKPVPVAAPPVKTWSFSWKLKIDWARAFLIFVLAYLIVWFFTNDVFLTITVTN